MLLQLAPPPAPAHPFGCTQVEEYLNDVIVKMRCELRAILMDSVAAYPTKPRDQWLFDWPSQIILVVNQIYWCQEVEEVGASVCLQTGCVSLDLLSQYMFVGAKSLRKWPFLRCLGLLVLVLLSLP